MKVLTCMHTAVSKFTAAFIHTAVKEQRVQSKALGMKNIQNNLILYLVFLTGTIYYSNPV